MHVGRSIWFPVVAHFINNALGIFYYFFYAKGSTDDMLEEIGTSTMIPVAALVSLLLFSVFFVLWYYRESNRISQSPRYGGTETG